MQVSKAGTEPRTLFTMVFDHSYVGPVYVRISSESDIPDDIEVTLKWGRLTLRLTLESFDDKGVTLTLSKLSAGPGRPPLRLRSSVPIFAVYGIGGPGDGVVPVIDCASGWVEEAE